MPHFLFEAVNSQGQPVSGAMEAQNAQAAHGKLVMSGHRDIRFHSDQNTVAMQEELASLTPAQRQETAKAMVKYSNESTARSTRLNTLIEVAQRNRFFLLFVGALAIYDISQAKWLAAVVMAVFLASPFLITLWRLRKLDLYQMLQKAMVDGEWDESLTLITRLRAKKDLNRSLLMDLDVREAQIHARLGGNVDELIAGLDHWRVELADKPGTFEARLISIFLAAKQYDRYIAGARASLAGAPTDASRVIELAMAEARFGSVAEARLLLDAVDTRVMTDLAVKYVHWVEGLIALKNGDNPRAVSELAQVVAAFRELSVKLPMAVGTLALSAGANCLALARLGRREEAATLLAEVWKVLVLHADEALLASLTQEVGTPPMA